MTEKGYEIVNVDATVLLERPKLRPYIDRMRERISAALGIPVSGVSVKASTEEGLGFTGREEGIAAQAVALIEGREATERGLSQN